VLTCHFLKLAADEIGVEIKQLLPETEILLNNLDWPGNVRQLENFCRWIKVMASGRDIHITDLPPELAPTTDQPRGRNSWEHQLRQWAEAALEQGNTRLLDSAIPNLERVMIETALKHTGGRKQEAAALLGWGRNTLTRKIKELKLET
ncbi:MAG: nitrogen regulation protein NR(I), partial [Thiotrichales bacterium]|nr:nitrogen regulation protein NR(I) [Thiotrichales bacterium]